LIRTKDQVLNFLKVEFFYNSFVVCYVISIAKEQLCEILQKFKFAILAKSDARTNKSGPGLSYGWQKFT